MTVTAPVTVQGEVKVNTSDPRDAETRKLEDEKKQLNDERTLKAAETAANYTRWSCYVAGGALLCTIAQIFVIIPTLRSLRIQATITRLNQVKQRLDSLGSGNVKVSEEALFTIPDEEPAAKLKRINHIADQLCGKSDKIRPAVEGLIRQWFELEAELDKQTLPGKTWWKRVWCRLQV